MKNPICTETDNLDNITETESFLATTPIKISDH